jgi:hypothetical protein
MKTITREIITAIQSEPNRNLRASMTRTLHAVMMEPEAPRSDYEIACNVEKEINAYMDMMSKNV